MPYGNQYTYEGTAYGAEPYSYLYYPSYGWMWLPAPGSGSMITPDPAKVICVESAWNDSIMKWCAGCHTREEPSRQRPSLVADATLDSPPARGDHVWPDLR